MKKLIFIVLTVFCVSLTFLNADVYIKNETKSTMKQMPTSYAETWVGKNKVANITPQQTFIIDMDAKKVVFIYPAKKTYVEATLPLDMSKLIPAQMAGMMQGMMSQMTVSVTPNGKTKKVLNYDCKGYNISMKVMGMDTKSTTWATTNLPFDWKSFFPIYKEMMKGLSFNLPEAALKEMMKIEGYPMSQENTVMGITTTITVIEINPNKVAPAGVYSVPAGFTKKPMLDFGGMK